MSEHNQHWRNPETGQAECECCCSWALDAERDRARIAALEAQLTEEREALTEINKAIDWTTTDANGGNPSLRLTDLLAAIVKHQAALRTPTR